MQRVTQVRGERRVVGVEDAQGPVDAGSDGLAGLFGVVAEPPGPTAAAYGAGELGDEGVAFQAAMGSTLGVVPDSASAMSSSRSRNRAHVSDPDGNFLELYVDGDPSLCRRDPTLVAHSDPLQLRA